MAVLLHTDKIDSVGPSSSVSFRVERFQVDSYAVRAASGINTDETKYNITWICLTQQEAEDLINQLKGTRGVETLEYSPPLENTVLDFSVEGYTYGLYTKQAPYTYTVSATLLKEYVL